MCDACKNDNGDPNCEVCKGKQHACSQCGGNMVNVESIKIGLCLWCRPWLKPKTQTGS